MIIDDLAADIESCLEEYDQAAARLRLALTIILNREHLDASTKETHLYAALLVKDSLGWLDTCKDMLGVYLPRLTQEED